ncbi:MAG: GntP family permease [Planctomycetia bacterium]|nr:GntP family permease [Planctomycetia bacterium]
MYLACCFAVAVTVLIVAISRWKIHPFLVLLAVSFGLAVAVGIPLKELPGLINNGFGKTFASIGLVILLGALIGAMLETSGAAVKLAEMVVRCVGQKHPAFAMGLMGWVVSIPVFCDSGFVILDPIRRNLYRKTCCSSVTLTVILAAGLLLAHVFIPPTPGPVAAAGFLGLTDHLLAVMGWGVLFSIPPFFVALWFAQWVGKRTHSREETDLPSCSEMLEAFGKLPNAVLSVLPIAMPIGFLALGSISAVLAVPESVRQIGAFLGTPVVALAVGVLCAIPLLVVSGKTGQFQTLTQETLKMAGPILFLTAAGGVLGAVIANTNLAEILSRHSETLSRFGIFFPFLFAAILKTSQGSSTVAIITTASMMGSFTDPNSMMAALGFTTTFDAIRVLLAVGAGSMVVSHANDSYFWVVTNFGGLSPEDGYKTHTAMTLLIGVTAVLCLWIVGIVC